MHEKSVHLIFSDNTKAALQSIKIHDQYGGLLEGTRTAYTKSCILPIHEEQEYIESMISKGTPCGRYIVEPELVSETRGNKLIGDCLKEYAVDTWFRTIEDDYYLDLKVAFFASKEEILNLGNTLNRIAAKIEYKKYCEHINIEDWD